MPLDLRDPTVYRPVFYARLLWPSTAPVVGLPFREGGWTRKYQWPMYYRGHNFKNMLSDFEYQSPGSLLPSEAAVQAFLTVVPTDTNSNVPSFLIVVPRSTAALHPSFQSSGLLTPSPGLLKT